MPLTDIIIIAIHTTRSVVLLSVDVGEDTKAGFRSGLCGKFACLLNALEGNTTPYSGDLREKPVLNGVPLRRVRGIVRHYYVNMEVFGKFDQLLLEKPAGTAVGTSTVTEQHDGSCMWIDVLEHTIPVVLEVVAEEPGCVMAYSEAHVSSILLNIVDAIGNDFAACKGGEVMVPASRRPVAVYLSASSEWADQLFLLRVYTEDGYVIFFTHASHCGDFLELFVSFIALCHRGTLLRSAFLESLFGYDLFEGVIAYAYSVIHLHLVSYDARRIEKHAYALILRQAAYGIFRNLPEDVDILGMNTENTLSASTFLPYVSGSNCVPALKLVNTSIHCISGDMICFADQTHAVRSKFHRLVGTEQPALAFVQIGDFWETP